MANDLKFSPDAVGALLEGVRKIAQAVGSTMGPLGRNVVISKPFGTPAVTKDGVTVAKGIELTDKFENLGANLVREAAARTNQVSGDGTSTATVLSYLILDKAVKSATSPVILKRQIEEAAAKVAEEIRSNVVIEVSKSDIENIASISANSPEIGKVIKEMVDKVGENGTITVSQSFTEDMTTEVVEGMRFQRGMVSPHMANNEKGEAYYEKIPVLVTDRKLINAHDVIPFLSSMLRNNVKRLFVIADDVQGDVVSTMVVNHIKGVMNIVAVKAPGFGEKRKDTLADIAALVGAKVVSADTGEKFSEIEPDSVLGMVEKLTVTKEHTTIMVENGGSDAVKSRVDKIKEELETVKSEFDKEKLEERLANLTGGIGVISVGAATESESNEKKQRIEDAVQATKAALEKGIVPGGAATLAKASSKVNRELKTEGSEILMGACVALCATIIANSGNENAATIAVDVANTENVNVGYNVLTGQMTDLVKDGVIDPAKVTLTALSNAVSISGLLMNASCLVVDADKGEPDPFST